MRVKGPSLQEFISFGMLYGEQGSEVTDIATSHRVSDWMSCAEEVVACYELHLV